MEPTAVKPEEEPAEKPAELAGMEPDERRLRICELVLVVGAAYLWSVISSLAEWWTGTRQPDRGAMNDVARIVHAAVAISVLAYVLNRQGRDLRSIGLTARLSDIPLTFVLWFFDRLFSGALASFLYSFSRPHPGSSHLYSIHWVAILPSAAAEELIVRAFLITEVAEIWNSVPLAVFVSIGVQTAYHLYQGTPAALMAAGGFFVYAVFYATTRRITPVILVHALHNFWVLSYTG